MDGDWVEYDWIDGSSCSQLGHFTVITYDRPWRKLFRKRMIIRCFDCDLKVIEP